MPQKLISLSRDTRPQEQPDGSYPFGKNGMQHTLKGATINEKGFQYQSVTIPFKQIGIIDSDKYPIIFSTDNVHSAIGYYNDQEDTYIPILDDRYLNFKLGFSTDHYITGQSQRNYKGEVIVAFTDKNNKPYYLNCDNPQVENLSQLFLFPVLEPPAIELNVVGGGGLLPGAYFAAVKCLRGDGTETAFVATSSPEIVTGTLNTITDKAIEIKLSGIDPNYNRVQVAVITKIAGKVSAVLLKPRFASTDTILLFTGAEMTEPITLEEILGSPAVYDKVGTIGQLNDALYIADLQSPPKLKMQRYANMIQLKWKSELISVTAPDAQIISGQKRSFMHQEVYNFYIRYKLTSGGKTDAMPIPGPMLTSSDEQASALATAEGLTAKRFQVEDTIAGFDPWTKTGYMGKWQNQTETYPDNIEYDSSDIGGEDLRNKPVRHHRLPSIAWCKQNLYQNEPEYGKSKLDLLSVTAENIIIPEEYANQIVGYELLYAKRSIGNSTVLGQSLYLFGARAHNDTAVNKYYSTGGNFESEIDFKSTNKMTLLHEQSIFHFHGFDTLFNKPSLAPAYLSFQLKLRRTNVPQTGGYIEDGLVNTKNDGPTVYLLDYMEKGLPPTVPAVKLKAVKDTEYVPNNMQIGKWENKGIEQFFGGRLSNPQELIPYSEISRQQVWPESRGGATPDSHAVKQETTFLMNLMALKTDLYSPVLGQTLVRAGQSKLNSSSFFSGGDVFISEYTFHTYGWWVSNHTDENNGMYKGTKVARRFICETAANLYGRYETPGNLYSQYYPKSPLLIDDLNNYLTKFIRTEEPNQFGYNKDLNSLDDLISSSIYTPLQEDITTHPYRIHRGGKLSRQSKTRSWRTFLPLDYYEAQKNMGRIVHLEGMDDRLLIHHEKALFLTQDKTRLESDILAVTLGSGDIFQFEPQEALSAKLGYAGTQHDLACIRTPYGYIFIDSEQGQIFKFKGSLELINNNLDLFFKEFMRLKEKNTFTGNGYTIGYDPEYKRLLLTVKNRQLIEGTAPVFHTEMLPNLTPGDIVLKDGRLQEYLGFNETGYSCQEDLMPLADDKEFFIAEDKSSGTLVGVVTGTHVNNFYLTTQQSTFSLQAATGNLKLIGALNYNVQKLYTLQAKAVNNNGNQVSFTITVNVIKVPHAPLVQNSIVTIPDNLPNGSSVLQVQASDSDGDALTYSILSGNSDGVFTIYPATGLITIANQSKIDYNKTATYQLTVSVSDGTLTGSGVMTILLTHIPKPLSHPDETVTIDDTTPDGVIIYTLTESDSESELTYEMLESTDAALFEFDPITRAVSLISNSSLNPGVTPKYELNFKVSDGNSEVQFKLTVNVLYDQETLVFEPYEPQCISSCPPGWELTDDGLSCKKITTVAATNNGSQVSVCPASNIAYANFGAIVYSSFNTNGTGVIAQRLDKAPWNNPTASNTIGVLNRCAVWGCTAIPDNEPIGFSVRVNIPTSKVYYIGVAGDNKCKIVINGVTLVDQDPSALATALSALPYGNQGQAAAFKWWHVYAAHLTAGVNYIGIEGVNFGSAAGFGAEIYDNTAVDLANARLKPEFLTNPSAFGSGVNYYDNLNLIFSTRWTRGGNFISGTTVGFSCPTGYALDTQSDPPVCNLVQTQQAQEGGRIWDKVRVKSTRLNQYLQTFKNEPGHSFQGISVPVYPRVPNHVDCGGSVTTYYNQPQSTTQQKSNCLEGTGSIVKVAIPGGLHVSTVSQASADAAAMTQLNSIKQQYANTHGFCIK